MNLSPARFLLLNLVGAFLSIKVAAAIASGIVEATVITPSIVFAGVVSKVLVPRSSHRSSWASSRCTWVIASAGVAIALGTYFGCWRVNRRLGKGLTEITLPVAAAVGGLVTWSATQIGGAIGVLVMAAPAET